MTKGKTLGQLADEGAPLCEVFDLVAKLCERRGWMPVGYRRIELSEGYASRNGWPAGIFTMFGGVLMVSEDALISALQRAVDEA